MLTTTLRQTMIAEMDAKQDGGKGAFVTEAFLVNVSASQAPAAILARWALSSGSSTKEAADAPPHFHSLDLLLRLLPQSEHHQFTKELRSTSDASGTALGTLVRHIWPLGHSSADAAAVAVAKVVLVPHDGFLCRSDILSIRMQHSEYVDTVVNFSAWDKHIPSLPAHGQDGSPTLLPLLLSSAGALLVRRSQRPTFETLDLLQQDMRMRLSFDWIIQTKPTARRMVIVGGRPMPDPKSGMHNSSGFFQAAEALGISIVVVDEPGHWLEGEKYAHLREDFIAMDLSDSEDLPERLAQTIRDRPYKIDGIVSFTDNYVVTTAHVAEILGLPTEPTQEMVRAHNKHEMRKVIQESSSIQAIALENIQQLDDPAFAGLFNSLRYPMVVKPCRGMTSKGVKKVGNEADMRQAVHMLDEDEEISIEEGILLETYVDGPEFDANFVLWEGQVLFLEVTDNFPCLADAIDATLANNFAETVQISNTRLPPDEVDIIRSSVHRSLLDLGFNSGVFHCEGRMMNSSMRYEDVRGDGILDLVPKSSRSGITATPSQKPEVFLIEVNVRSPGTGGTWATLSTYGVDLGALQFLHGLNDCVRFEALSAPYAYSSSSPGDGGGAQWWTAHCMIPIHRDKIRVPDDLFEKLFQALPEIVPYVIRAEMYAAPGAVVSTTAGIGWIAYLLLGSRISRAHALDMYHHVAETSKKVLDASNYDSGYES